VYGFTSGIKVSFLIINKDTNPLASGAVQINMITDLQMNCIYMSASSLTSKNITLAGYSFIGGNSTPQGNYTSFNYNNSNNIFMVSLNYSSVAFCTVPLPNLAFQKVVLT
jgi:hypothetical protein